ncbi:MULTISPECIES: GrpB family protein [unclassified Sinorhizobium]|uniref:GrpB family protein n=1 Tax=unclassified Sinorhizobium TaxID=2613772 RepID=UPI003525C6B1
MREIRIVDYDPAWPTLFEALGDELAALLGNRLLAVHHIGSTSVPNLPAKPKIDMDAVIVSHDVLPEAIALVKADNYVFHGDPYGGGRWIFTRDHERHGFRLYLCGPDNPAHRDRILFRDYLRQHPQRAQAYADLKRRLAARADGDWDFYTGGKSAFVAETLVLAGRSG